MVRSDTEILGIIQGNLAHFQHFRITPVRKNYNVKKTKFNLFNLRSINGDHIISGCIYTVMLG